MLSSALGRFRPASLHVVWYRSSHPARPRVPNAGCGGRGEEEVPRIHSEAPPPSRAGGTLLGHAGKSNSILPVPLVAGTSALPPRPRGGFSKVAAPPSIPILLALEQKGFRGFRFAGPKASWNMKIECIQASIILHLGSGVLSKRPSTAQIML